MVITSLKLDQFRNYESLDLSFHPGITLFYGENAQGKTNILEAIYLAGTTRSHRSRKDREMIRFGQEEAHLRLCIKKQDLPYRIDLHLKKNKSKGIAINQMPIKRAGELIGLGHYVFFSPEDLGIVKNGPSERRRFLDMELCQLSASYLHDLSSYQRVLQQRSLLLKTMKSEEEKETLDVWDLQLVHYGSNLIDQREAYLETLAPKMEEIHRKITGGKETLTLRYEKNVEKERFAEAIWMDRERDLRFQMTHSGPHRDDLRFEANGIDLRSFGSQGQQRTAALSLKLAEIELIRELSGDAPVLMLDDVLSELDENRQKYLLETIHQTQTLITGTGMERLEDGSMQVDEIYEVKHGHVERKNYGR